MARRSAPPLLLLLLVVLLPLSEWSCVASTTPAQLTGAAVTSLPDSLVDMLWTTISRAVRTSVESAASELEGRLSGLQVQLTQLAVTLAGLQSQQEAQNATLTQLAVTLAGLQSQQEAQNATLQRQLTQLTVTLAGLQSQQEAQNATLQRQLAVTLAGLQEQQEAHNATHQRQLTQLAETLSGLQEAQNVTHQRQLQALETGVASVQSQQEAQNATLQRQLQAIETGVAAAQSRLESQLEGVQNRMDSRLGDVQSRFESTLSEITSRLPPRDCSDLLAGTKSGIHQLLLPNLTQVPAFCDQQTDGGGWITFQRRKDIKPRQDFFLGWEAYKRGFGALEGEFWWGLEYLYRTTSLQLDRRYELRIDMTDFEGGKRFALYQDFRISSEADGYRLHVANYSGDAGDSLIPLHNGMAFSTKDKDQDTASGHCAQHYKGAWWYGGCHQSNLNGLYLGGANTTLGQGIIWGHWRGNTYSLKSVEMKMRPAKRTS